MEGDLGKEMGNKGKQEETRDQRNDIGKLGFNYLGEAVAFGT